METVEVESQELEQRLVTHLEQPRAEALVWDATVQTLDQTLVKARLSWFCKEHPWRHVNSHNVTQTPPQPNPEGRNLEKAQRIGSTKA